MKKFAFILLFLSTALSYSQTNSNHDLSGWFWVQLYKKLPKDFYVSLQYQLRVKENISQYDLNNFYFIGGWNANKYINLEALYQFSTSFQNDGHTFYAGLTGKYTYKHFTFYARTSFQHRRNDFTGVYNIDHIKNEWRNRIKIRYRINRYFNFSVFSEPYLLFTEGRDPHISRIRSGVHFSVVFNKYQALTAFYLYQPNIISNNPPFTLHVIGLTWQIKFPDSFKKFKKIFKSKIFKPDDGNSNADDLNEEGNY